jgi:hypothetical protein
MAKINQQPRAPLWPWGGPRSVRDRLVDPSQLDRKKKKAGDPKNPALASSALLDFIAPAHSSEELRLPLPPHPGGDDAPLESFTARPQLASVAQRDSQESRERLERGLSQLQVAPERMDRLRGLLEREAQMLEVVGGLNEDVKDIIRRMWWEQNEDSY